jgi:hypothetical protein
MEFINLPPWGDLNPRSCRAVEGVPTGSVSTLLGPPFKADKFP